MKTLKILLLLLLLTSCNKDDKKEDRATALTASSSKKWKLVEAKLDGSNVVIEDCRKDDSYEYFKDGTRKIDVVDSLCDPRVINPKQYYYASWNLYANNDSLRIVVPNLSIPLEYKIIRLRADVLEMQTNIIIMDSIGHEHYKKYNETYSPF